MRNWKICNAVAALLLYGNFLGGFSSITQLFDFVQIRSSFDWENGNFVIGSEQHQRPTYRDLQDDVFHKTWNRTWVYQSSFDRATGINKADSWFQPRRRCKETCCVETVAISLSQDDTKPINWRSDHQDLADVRIQKFVNDDVTIFAQNLNEAMIPCLLPGTIIALDNYDDVVQYFWFQVRPKIMVPYILITGGSDSDAPIAKPSFLPDYIKDPLLIHWYATNPNYSTNSIVFQNMRHEKFQSMLSGLSYVHPQHRYLMTYLELTNFTNPFRNRKRWTEMVDIEDFDRDVFVHFGIKNRRIRWPIWNALCGNNTTSIDPTSRVSCNRNTETIPLHQIYQEMSTAKFGISPVGKGYDCYRHYELLLLGVIPVVWERNPASIDLYEGLPVIQIPNMDKLSSREEYVQFIQQYIQSDKFQNSTESFAASWEKLFLRHKRRMVLEKSGRSSDIIRDPEGNEYYQGYRYSPDNGGRPIYCHNAIENCALREDAILHPDWLDTEAGARVDQDWIDSWNDIGGGFASNR
ncbi:hypothetical protein IV203_017601 [Nitzschia inconspicua]|nr:hypothetical protein IV203_017601 [Nitzschia inconspicua]